MERRRPEDNEDEAYQLAHMECRRPQDNDEHRLADTSNVREPCHDEIQSRIRPESVPLGHWRRSCDEQSSPGVEETLDKKDATSIHEEEALDIRIDVECTEQSDEEVVTPATDHALTGVDVRDRLLAVSRSNGVPSD